MTRLTLLPQPDYQRIYQVIYTVLEASGIAVTHRSCIFFAAAGASILREHYDLSATISAGCMAFRVDEIRANVIVYGRSENGYFMSDEKALHAWVECEGWLIDFMAPIMGIALQQSGTDWAVPTLMLQKRLEDSKSGLGEIRHVGDFIAVHNDALAESLVDNQPVNFFKLINTCIAWYRRPPEQLKAMVLANSRSPMTALMLRAPSIEGAW